MNDALKQNAEAETPPDEPETDQLPTVVQPESSTKGPEGLLRPSASFLETVYYWVIAHS